MMPKIASHEPLPVPRSGVPVLRTLDSLPALGLGGSRRAQTAMSFFRPVLHTVLLVLLSGCAAISSRVNNGAGRPYAGLRDDAHYLAHPPEADMPLLQPLNMLDMPFSFVVDTLCLPYDLMKHSGQPNKIVPPEPPPAVSGSGTPAPRALDSLPAPASDRDR